MDPEQRHEYELNEIRQNTQSHLSGLERRIMASDDRTAFADFASRKGLTEATRGKVEAEFKKVFDGGGFINREVLAKYIVGGEILDKGGKAKGQQQRRGQERIAAERARATGGRSDVETERRPRGDTAEARRKRLANQNI